MRRLGCAPARLPRPTCPTPAALALPLAQEESLVGQAFGGDQVEAYLRQLAASQQEGAQAQPAAQEGGSQTAASDGAGAPAAS